MATKVTIIGANGRMGLALVRALVEFPALSLYAAVTNPGHPDAGRDVGELAGRGPLGVTIGTDVAAALAGADVAIDFSHASATAANVANCQTQMYAWVKYGLVIDGANAAGFPIIVSPGKLEAMSIPGLFGPESLTIHYPLTPQE